ncbi:hypothetical protein Agabi119p4_10525 [Agaricus bisporus var. burnettii]|uniref:Mitochondrial carrier protein n=1 Tax=Agaricus bisporus var. burnettii TaxID=192524 RepID=A0A8H7C2E7_AGABI|nr:hypothetical protein Agabi119p4_10525 [Agaricus bisporus var. burnettii]
MNQNMNPSPQMLVNILAGALAGISEHAVMFPIDSIKGRRADSFSFGVGNAFTRILSTEGMRTLYRGAPSVVVGAGPAHNVHFGTLEVVKELAGGNEARNQWLVHSLTGASATIASDALMNPFDVIKQRMQLHKSEFCLGLKCATTVYRTEGLAQAFYVSYPTTFAISIPFNSVQYTVYEQVKHFMNPRSEYFPVNEASMKRQKGKPSICASNTQQIKTHMQDFAQTRCYASGTSRSVLGITGGSFPSQNSPHAADFLA